MHIDFLTARFGSAAAREAIIFRDRAYTYHWLLDRLRFWQDRLERESVQRGMVVVLNSGFSPNSVAILLALIEQGCIVLPMTHATGEKSRQLLEIGQVEAIVSVDSNDAISIFRTGRTAVHNLYASLREAAHPGLVLFSSGSTGKSKGAVHDLSRLLAKFRTRRHDLRTLAFLLFDHIGGIDTLF